MNAPIDDKELEEYLGRRSRVSGHYRDLGTAEVPAHLDELILHEARTAVAKPDDLARVREKRRRLMQWGIPATLAACSLLVISIVIRSGLRHEVLPAEVRGVEQTAAAPSVAAKAIPDEQAKEEQGVVLIAPPRDAVTEFSSLAPAPANVAAQARADRERDAAERIRAQSIAVHAQRAQELLKSSLEVAQPHALESAGAAAEPQSAPPPAPVPVAAAVPAAADADASQKRAAVQQSAAVAHQDTRAREEDDSLDEILVTGLQRQSATARSGPRGTVPQSSGGDVSAEQWENEQMRAHPEQWLEHIRQLRRDGKSRAADREWKAFREQYPAHVVAEDDLARADR